MSEFQNLSDKNCPPSIYYVDSGATNMLVDWAQQHGFRIFYIEGSTVVTGQDFLTVCEEVMEFPYFGNNWDALEDCMGDLSWYSDAGFVLIYDNFQFFAQNDAQFFLQTIDVMREIVSFRCRMASKIPPMYIFLMGDKTLLPAGITYLAL